MKRLILLVILSAGPCAAPEPQVEEMSRKIIRFELAWDKFVRRYFGCPEGRVLTEPAAECKLTLGKLDYSQFAKARLAAKELFELKDKD